MKSVITLKSILRILGIIACAAVIITMTACSGTEGPMGPAGPAGADGAPGPQGPIGPANVYTVTFATPAGATQVPSQKVLETQFAYDPSYIGIEVRKPIPTPTAKGLYAGAWLIGWKKQSGSETEKVYNKYEDFYTSNGWKELFNLSYTPITGNITLVPVWVKETKVEYGSNTLADAISWINYYGGNNNYVIALDATAQTPGELELKQDNVDLKIIGIGATATTITLTGVTDGSLFTLGEERETYNVSLTIGDKIELKGIATGTDQQSPLVQIYQGTTFTMLTGSKISSNVNTQVGGAGAVYVNGGIFIMEGGTIDGIKGTATVIVSGYIDPGMDERFFGSFDMKGGTISNSAFDTATSALITTGITGLDVFADGRSSFTLSGNTSVIALMPYSKVSDDQPVPYSPISINSSWSGALTLHLMGVMDGDDPDASVDTFPKLAKVWNGKTIVDTVLTTAQTAKITLGKLLLATDFSTTAITGSVSAAGVLTITAPTPAP